MPALFDDPEDQGQDQLAGLFVEELQGKSGFLDALGNPITADTEWTNEVGADDSLRGFQFAPEPNAFGTNFAQLVYRFKDTGGTQAGGLDTDIVKRTLNINVIAVNDPPIGANRTLTITEEQPHYFVQDDWGFDDPVDGTAANSFLSVTIETVPTTGGVLEWYSDANQWEAANAGLKVPTSQMHRLRFIPNLDAFGNGLGAFDFRVQDNGGTAGGGWDYDLQVRTLDFNIQPVGDAPSGANGTVAAVEDTAYQFSVSDFGFSDPNDSPPDDFVGVRVVTLPDADFGILQSYDSEADSWLDVQAEGVYAPDSLQFVPLQDKVGSVDFQFRVVDSGDASQQGAINEDPLNRNMTITIENTNDSPSLTESPPIEFTQLTENQTDNAGDSVVAVILNNMADIDPNWLYGIAVQGLDGQDGEWLYSTNQGVNWAPIGEVSETSALLLRGHDRIKYIPNEEHATEPTLTIRAWDQTGATANQYGTKQPVVGLGPGSPYSPTTAVARMLITDVNDAPVMPPGVSAQFGSIDENQLHSSGELVQDLLGDHITDVDPGALLGVALVGSSSSSGTWQFSLDDGLSWSNAGVLTTTQALLLRATDRIRFKPDGNNGGTHTLVAKAWDQTGDSFGQHGTKVSTNLNGGFTPFSIENATAAINVADVNDAPTVADGFSYQLPNTSLDFASQPVSVSTLLEQSEFEDVDNNSPSGIAVYANVGVGHWQYSTSPGVWIEVGAVSSAASLLLDASAELRFVPEVNTEETASLSFVAWDQSAGTATSGANKHFGDSNLRGGEAPFSQGTGAVSINAIETGPLAFDGTITVDEDLVAVLSQADFPNNVDGSVLNGFSRQLVIKSLPEKGKLLHHDGNAVAVDDLIDTTIYGYAQAEAGSFAPTLTTLQYLADRHEFGDNYTTIEFLVVENGVESNVATVTVKVNPINDTPQPENDFYKQENVVTGNVMDNDQDVDNSHATLTALLVNPPSSAENFTFNPDGSFSYTPSAGVTNDSFTYRLDDGLRWSNPATVELVVSSTLNNETLNVAAVADSTYHEGMFGGNNDGSSTSLTAYSDSNGFSFSTAWIEFSFPPVQNANVTSSTLNLEVLSRSAGNGYDLGYLTSPLESGWEQDPFWTPPSGTHLATVQIATGQLSVDIPASVMEEALSTGSLVLSIDAPQAGGFEGIVADFASREHSNADWRPQLDVAYTTDSTGSSGVEPTADSTIINDWWGGSNENSGSTPILESGAGIDQSWHTWLEFPLDANTPTGDDLLGGSIRLFVEDTFGANAQEFFVHDTPFAPGWESDPNWSPPPGEQLISSATLALGEINVPIPAEVIRSRVLAGDTSIRFAIKDISFTYARYASRENPDAAKRPKFVVHTESTSSSGNAVPTTSSPPQKSVARDDTIVLTSDMFPFDDADSDDILRAVRIDATPNGATLTIDGVVAQAGDVVSLRQMDLGQFVYVPGDSAGQSAFGFSVSDGVDWSDTEYIVVNITGPKYPRIDFINNVVVREDDSISLTVELDDPNTSEWSLSLSAESYNQSLVPDANISISGNGPARTLEIVPTQHAYGTTEITLTTSDGANEHVRTFFVDFWPWRDAPEVSLNPPSYIINGESLDVPFTLFDPDTNANDLVLTVMSEDQVVLSDSDLSITGTGSSRILTIDASNASLGTTTINLTVSDGPLEPTVVSFPILVRDPTPPTISPLGSFTMNEDESGFEIDFTVGDSETPLNELVLSATSNNATLVAPSGLQLSGNDAGRMLTISPNANQHGTTEITISVTDGHGLTSSETLQLLVNSVNDRPMGVDGSAQILEEEVYTFSISDFPLSDPNDSPENQLAGIRIQSTPPANEGKLLLNGSVVNSGGGQFVAAAELPMLQFVPEPNVVGVGKGGFSFQVYDDGGTENGGFNKSLAANEFLFDITNVNDAPRGISSTEETNEDKPWQFSTNSLGFSDPLDNPANNLSEILVNSLPTSGTLLLNGSALTVPAVIPVSELTNLFFHPASNHHGDAGEVIFQLRDDGGTENSGEDLSAEFTLSFNVKSINDEPQGTDNTIAIFEDQAHSFSPADFGFSDPNDSPPDGFAGIEIVSLPTEGNLLLNGNSFTVPRFISSEFFDQLSFIPPLDAHGSGLGSFDFRVVDNGGNTGGGHDTDSSPNSIAFDITSLNDGPVGENRIIVIDEDTPHVFASNDFGYQDDVDAPNSHNFIAVRLTTLPTEGSLEWETVAGSGQWEPAALDQAIPIEELGRLRFVPTNHANGTNVGNFLYKVQDDGGTANGGEDWSPIPAKISFDANPINDAPELNKNGGFPFTTITEDNVNSSGDLIADVIDSDLADIDSANLGIALVGTQASHGAWQYSLDGGASWAAVGSVSEGSALLLDYGSRLRFLPDAIDGNEATVSFRGWDQYDGNAVGQYVSINSVGGSSAYSEEAATATLSVTPVNDAPEVTSGQVNGLVLYPGVAQSVGGLLDAAEWSDVDPSSLRGIGVVSILGNGDWEYSTDGVAWHAIGATSLTQALLLSEQSQIRYQLSAIPGTATIQFVAWDQTVGTASTESPSYGNAFYGGGTNAFSLNLASTFVSLPNSEPIFTSNSVTSVEVGAQYRYLSTATDAEGDSLEFSIGAINWPDGYVPPNGQEIEFEYVNNGIEQYGVYTWTAPAELAGRTVGIEEAVSDGTSTVRRSFDLAVSPVPDNNAPVIVSEPDTDYHLPVEVTVVDSPDPVTPSSISLSLGDGQEQTVQVSIDPTQFGNPMADVVVVLDTSGSMQDAIDWTGNTLQLIHDKLIDLGIGTPEDGATGSGFSEPFSETFGNRYALLTYRGTPIAHSIADYEDDTSQLILPPANSDALWGNVSQLKQAVGLVTAPDGGTEPGLDALQRILSSNPGEGKPEYEFRANATPTIILVTDEEVSEGYSLNLQQTILDALVANPEDRSDDFVFAPIISAGWITDQKTGPHNTVHVFDDTVRDSWWVHGVSANIDLMTPRKTLESSYALGVEPTANGSQVIFEATHPVQTTPTSSLAIAFNPSMPQDFTIAVAEDRFSPFMQLSTLSIPHSSNTPWSERSLVFADFGNVPDTIGAIRIVSETGTSSFEIDDIRLDGTSQHRGDLVEYEGLWEELDDVIRFTPDSVRGETGRLYTRTQHETIVGLKGLHNWVFNSKVAIHDTPEGIAPTFRVILRDKLDPNFSGGQEEPTFLETDNYFYIEADASNNQWSIKHSAIPTINQVLALHPGASWPDLQPGVPFEFTLRALGPGSFQAFDQVHRVDLFVENEPIASATLQVNIEGAEHYTISHWIGFETEGVGLDVDYWNVSEYEPYYKNNIKSVVAPETLPNFTFVDDDRRKVAADFFKINHGSQDGLAFNEYVFGQDALGYG
ncbi:MAG: Ig-like domain-containing protein [Planctomycetota bacterium]